MMSIGRKTGHQLTNLQTGNRTGNRPKRPTDFLRGVRFWVPRLVLRRSPGQAYNDACSRSPERPRGHGGRGNRPGNPVLRQRKPQCPQRSNTQPIPARQVIAKRNPCVPNRKHRTSPPEIRFSNSTISSGMGKLNPGALMGDKPTGLLFDGMPTHGLNEGTPRPTAQDRISCVDSHVICGRIIEVPVRRWIPRRSKIGQPLDREEEYRR